MKHAIFAAAMLLAALPAHAEIMAHEVSARLGIGERPGVMFAMLHNKGAATKLVAAQSPSFERIELHTHEHNDGMMRMVKVDSFAVPAKGMLKLQPGGNHLMLFGHKGKKGEAVNVTLRFADGREVSLSAALETRRKNSHQINHSGH